MSQSLPVKDVSVRIQLIFLAVESAMEELIESCKTGSTLLFLGNGIKTAEKARALEQRGISVASGDLSIQIIQKFSNTEHILLLIEPDFQTNDSNEITQLISALNPKPQIIAIAKRWNVGALPFALQFTTIEHQKSNGARFIDQLISSIEPSQESSSRKAPRPPSMLIGRETELSTLNDYLTTSGRPILLQGVSGIGKRALLETALLKIRGRLEKEERAEIQAQPKKGNRSKGQRSRHQPHRAAPVQPKRDPNRLTVLPELSFNPFFAEDALLGFIAVAAAEKGDARLQKKLSLRKDRPAPYKLIPLVIDTLQKEHFSNTYWVISNLSMLVHRSSGEFSKLGFLELLLLELLRSELAIKIILLTDLPIHSFDPSQSPRKILFQGLSSEARLEFLNTQKRTDLELEESELNHLLELTKGHPIALQNLANALNSNISYQQIIDDRLAAPSPRSLEAGLKKRLELVTPTEMAALKHLHLYRTPVHFSHVSENNLPTKVRSALIQKGILSQSLRPVEATEPSGQKSLYLHRKIKSLLPKERNKQLIQSKVAQLQEKAKGARKGFLLTKELSLILEANALLARAHRGKDSWNTSVPFCDPLSRSIRDLIFNRSDFKRAESQLRAGFAQCPLHSTLLLLEASLQRKSNKKRAVIEETFEYIQKKAATPESFIQEAMYHRDRTMLDRAIETLLKGIDLFPSVALLKRELGRLLLQNDRYQEAINHLVTAAEQEPLHPLTHCYLGGCFTHFGEQHWTQSEELFEKAELLFKRFPVQSGVWMATLCLYKAKLCSLKAMNTEGEQRSELWQKTEALLRQGLSSASQNPELRIELATVLMNQHEALSEDLSSEVNNLLAPLISRNRLAGAHIQQARYLIRLKELDGIEALLDHAYKISPQKHSHFAVRAEFFQASGDLLRSFSAYQSALIAVPEGSPLHKYYTSKVEQLRLLLEQASENPELLRGPTELAPPAQISEEELAAKQEQLSQEEGFRNDVGSVRRRSQAPQEEKTEEEKTEEEKTEEEKTEEEKTEEERL